MVVGHDGLRSDSSYIGAHLESMSVHPQVWPPSMHRGAAHHLDPAEGIYEEPKSQQASATRLLRHTVWSYRAAGSAIHASLARPHSAARSRNAGRNIDGARRPAWPQRSPTHATTSAGLGELPLARSRPGVQPEPHDGRAVRSVRLRLPWRAPQSCKRHAGPGLAGIHLFRVLPIFVAMHTLIGTPEGNHVIPPVGSCLHGLRT